MTTDDGDAIPEGHVNWEGPARCSRCGLEFALEMPIPKGTDRPTIAVECPGCGVFACRPLPDPARN